MERNETRRRSRSAQGNHFESKERSQERPSLPKELASEIRQAFILKRSKKLRERKGLIAQVMKRRERKQSKNEPETTFSKTRANEDDAVDKRNNPPSMGETATTSFETTDDKPRDPNLECPRPETPSTLKKIAAKDAQIQCFQQQITDLQSETHSLRKKLEKWQNKSKRLGELRTKEQTKFDNATNLVKHARVGLTKALNDASRLEAKIFDLDRIIEERDRRLDDLYETVDRQSEKLRTMNAKLQDKDTLLRVTQNEKRTLEDEVEILRASKDETDKEKILKHLLRERETWLRKQETNMEEERIQLDQEKNELLKRETLRHQQESQMAIETANRRKAIEEKETKMQVFVNQQLADLMKTNVELQEKLTAERERWNSELRQQDDTIASLENEVTGLGRRLATRNRSETELAFRIAENEALQEELLDAQRRNQELESNNGHGVSRSTKQSLSTNPKQLPERSLAPFYAWHKEKQERQLDLRTKSRTKLRQTKRDKKKKTKKKTPKKKAKKKKMEKKKKRKERKKSKKRKKSIDLSSMKVLKQNHGRTEMNELLLREGASIQSGIPRSILCIPTQ